MAGKSKSYGQFDQGPGQRYAKGRGKDKGPGPANRNERATSPAPTRAKTEDEVRAEMRAKRRGVLQAPGRFFTGG